MSHLLRNVSFLLLLALLLPVLFLAQGPVFTTGQWVADLSLSQGRTGACTVTLAHGRMLVTGGIGTSGALTSAQFLGTGGAAAPMGVARSEHFCVTLDDGLVLVSGGRTTGNAVTNAAEIYNPSTGAWTPIASALEARAGATVTLLEDGRVLIAGGEGSAVPLQTMQIFDPVSGQFSNAAPMSSPRKNHAAALLPRDGRVVIAGGSNGSAVLASIDIYDPASNSVSSAPSMSTPRAGLSATALLDKRVLLAGGGSAGTEILNLASGSITPGPVMSAARTAPFAMLLPTNNTVLIAGGSASSTSAEVFVPWQNQFHPFGTLSAARTGAAIGASKQSALARVAGGTAANGVSTAVDAVRFPTVVSDKDDYSPGTTAVITGTGFQPGDTVTLTMLEEPNLDTHGPFTSVADGNGNFTNTQFVPDEEDVGIRFYLAATGQTSGLTAGTTFTDARQLLLTFAGTGSGSVTITPSTGTVNAPVACGGTGANAASQTVSSTCLPNVSTSDNGATVTFLATAAGGSTFAGWSLPANVSSSTCTGTTNPCSAVLGSNPALTVTFSAGSPDLTVTKTNNVGGSTTYPAGWTWTLTVANGGTAAADFAIGNTIVTDNLPNASVAYGGVTTTLLGGTTGTINCSISSSNLSCSAGTAVSIPAGGSYTAVFSATPSAPGSFANPRAGGVCSVDPGGAVSESNEGNNSCSNSVTVNARAITVKAADISRVYGQSTPAFSFILSVGTLAAGDTLASLGTPTFSTDPNPGTGTHPITVSGLSNANYTITYDNTGVLTVTPRPVTVKANDVSRVYGDSAPAFSISLTVGTFGYTDTLASLGTPIFTTDPNPGTGTHPITVSGLSNANYTITYDNTGVLTVTTRPVTVKANDVSRVYGDSTPAFSIFLSVGTFGDTDTLASLGAPSFSTDPNPGTGTHPITVSGLSNANYTITYDNTGVLAVTPRPVTVKANDVSRVYGDSTPAFSIFLSVGTLGYTDTLASLGAPSFSTDPNPGTGTHPITVSGLSNANYTITYDNTGVLTVTPRPVTVKANAVSRVYGDSTPAFSIFLSVGTFGYADTLTSLGTPLFTTDPNPGTGTHPITVSGLSNANYTVTYDKTGVLTVTPRPVTVKANDVSRVYGDSTPAFSIFLSVGTFGYSDNAASLGTPIFGSPVNPGVGTYPITVSGLSNANYTITYDNTGVLTVTPRPVTAKVNAVSRVYGDSTPAFSIFLSVGTLGYTDTLASLGAPIFGSPVNPVVGTYAITVSGLSNANYTITYDNTGVLTVTPRPVTAKVNAVSRVYGDSTPAFSIFLSVGSFGYTDTLASLGTPSFSTDPNPGTGTHPITVSGLSNANYTITYDNTGVLTVTPRPVAVKANAVSRVYGDSTPAFSIFLSVGTFGYTDTLASLGAPSFSTDPNPGTGTHPITVSGLSNANYTITYDNTGVLTVTPRPVTVKANDVSRVYGDSTPAFSIFLSVGTFGYSDNAASLGTPIFGSPVNPGVGTYPITVSGLSNANYTITYDNTGVLTVTPRPVAVKANAVSRVYGDSTPAFSIFLSVGTLGYTDTLASLGAPIFGSPVNPVVGTYAITVSGLSNANYTITYDNTGVLTVTPRPVAVKANDVSRVYGDSPPAFSIFLSVGSFGYTDTLASLGTPSFSTDPNPGTGTHPITVSGLSNANYTITYDNTGVLTVTPRPVAVKANAVSRVYGDSTPAFSIFLSVGTFGYADTLASLGAPSFSTDPNPGTGTHPIAVSGLSNANYTITYDNTGVLTVTPRPVTVKANDVSRVYGDSTPAFSIFLSVGTFGYSDNAASLGTPIFGSPVNPGVGTYPITVSGLSNANYTITYNNTGVLTVTPRPTLTGLTSSLYMAVTPVRVDLTATVTSGGGGPTPLGTVTFSDSIAGPLGTVGLSVTGTAALSTTSLGVGQHMITATYTPSTLNFTGSLSATNTAPVATITGPAMGSLNPTNAPFTFTATFTDAVGNTPNATAAWSFDTAITVAGTVAETSGSGTVTKSYPFAGAGVYAVQLTVSDNAGGITMTNTISNGDPAFVVVYDPNGGFVTGGGWIMSPIVPALPQFMSVSAKANFGFVSKYQKGATLPTGDTEFQFKEGNLNFKSSSYDWLVVAGARAQYKGVGTINGSGNYGFLLTAVDSQVNGGGNADKFRIKIWDKNSGDAIVYDNQYGQVDDSDAGTTIGGGSVVIHK